MTRERLFGALLVTGVLAIAAYVATNTYWDEAPVPTPLRGEAATNPFYGAERLAQALGARTARGHTLTLPPTDAVIVLSAWHWDLSVERQAMLQGWVEDGGRLVVDRMLSGDLTGFVGWSGIDEDFNEKAYDAYMEDDNATYQPCRSAQTVTPADGPPFTICDTGFAFLTTKRPAQWAVRDSAGDQVIRVAVGRGSVTRINTMPFTWREVLDGDHGRLFVAATQLRRGDFIQFLTEDDHPSLPMLSWIYGAPAVVLAAMLMMLLLWRGASRFGPLAEVAEPRRRSMAEQIRGSGRFVLGHGDGAPLHAAAARALTEAARRRVPGYARLSRKGRAGALAKATGMDGDMLVSAMEDVSKRRPKELPNTLSTLETARRQLVVADPQRPGIHT